MHLSKFSKLFILLPCLCMQLMLTGCVKAEAPLVLLPKSGLASKDLAVIVNTEDALSVKIGDYYRQKRGIRTTNIIEIAFTPGKSAMSPDEFAVIKAQVDKQTPANVQAYALTWAAPYKVGCMSIGTAFAMGYHLKHCAGACQVTASSPYALSETLRPFDHYRIRPTMSLAASNFADAKALIDRGVASDGWALESPDTTPTAYLVVTSDSRRNVRTPSFEQAAKELRADVRVRILETEAITNRKDIMFYFTGAVSVRGLKKNEYLPGAMADHLTSSGGQLTDSRQMSALRWLEAGATGSYGTVVEPCAYTTKFPDPAVAMGFYVQGATLIEAYWKSVRMPGQGIFIGEPLASPYRGYSIKAVGNTLRVRSNQLVAGSYRVLAADQAKGPFRVVMSDVSVNVSSHSIWLKPPYQSVYKFVRL